MSKLNPQARAALQSARAKNRKAVNTLGLASAEHGFKVPKNIVSKMTALEDWYNTQLAPATKKADPSETHDTPIAQAA